MRYLALICLIVPACTSIGDWQPVAQPELHNLKGIFSSDSHFPSLPSLVAQSYQQPGSANSENQCELYKVGFTQDLYFQYIQYKINFPELKEFTVCYWSKFLNHSNDHPIFSYAVDGQPKAISAWISNTERSSYFSLAVEGHTFYRLNYPLRLNRWYHTCQSWNGRTGEWQIWVNAERVGRGFHNRLVGHTVPAGGIGITGQEQTQTGGGFLEGEDAPKGAGGMLGEITLVQLYSVALTAGKAHRDHKHHHAHTFDHNGVPITTTPRPPQPPRPLTPTHPLLTGGQLNPNIALTIASGQTQQLPPQIISGQTFNSQLLNGQFVNSLVTQQLMNAPQSRGPQQFLPQDTTQLPQQPQLQFGSPLPIQQNSGSFISQSGQGLAGLPQNSPSSLSSGGLIHSSFLNPANVQYLDTRLETHQLFKRDNEDNTKVPRSNKNDRKKLKQKGIKATIDPLKTSEDSEHKKHIKRELILHGGTIIDDGNISNEFDQSLLDGLAAIGQNQPVQQLQKQYDEREPAEAEVKAVMNVCSSCDEEPFGKALVFGWRTVPKKLYSGAFYTPAVPQCKAF